MKHAAHHALSTLFVCCMLTLCIGSLECKRLALCSVGKVKPILQDITTAQGLKAALNARSYKKEIFTGVSSYLKLVHFLQLYWNLYYLGYEHILLLTYNLDDCKLILQHAPYLGVCTWDTFSPGPMLDGAYLLWHLRYRELARIVRAGYNAWALDTDVYFFRDPYTFLKSPPFSNMTVFHQNECVWEYGSWYHLWSPNGGFIYVQNAKPNGVAMWYLTEITYRPLRWMEDDWKLLRSLDVWNGCGLLDQDTIADILPSLVTGVPIFAFTGVQCFRSQQSGVNYEFQIDVSRDEGMQKNSHVVDVSIPSSWVPVVGKLFMQAKYIEMKMPNIARAKYNEKHGLNLYPRVRGNLSTSFLQLLSEDCPMCGFWPEVEDPSKVEEAGKVPTENLMIFPDWFVLGWWARGRYGFWDSDPVQQVIGHMNYNPAAPGKHHKLIGLMGMNKWNWSVSHAIYGPNVFQANEHLHDPHVLHPEQVAGHSIASQPLRLLAFAPSVDLTRTTEPRELQELVKGLLQVALLTKRVVLWPDVPCSQTKWMVLDVDGDKIIPRKLMPAFFPWGGPLGNQSCMWWGYVTEECSARLRGMSVVEFMEYKRMYSSQFQIDAGPQNTVLRWQGAPQSGSLLETIVELDALELQRKLTSPPYAKENVLYIANPVTISNIERDPYANATYSEMSRTCAVLKLDYVLHGPQLGAVQYKPKKGLLTNRAQITV